MRKHTLVLLCLAVVLVFASAVMAGVNPGTGIKSTSHDLSATTGKGATWAPSSDPLLDRICIYCHAPHHTLKSADAVAKGINYFPLWNHALSTITSYTPYSNGTEVPGSIQHQLNATIGQPGSVSKLCLSCHDGSVAVGAYGYAPSSSIGTTNVKASGRILIGDLGNLQNHHPIGFDYGAVQAVDDEIKDPTSVLLGNNPDLLAINDLLWGGKMECSSCHDVHNTKNTGMKFLWVEDTSSNLCFSCHDK
ncbi:MAG: cytochrome c3 family protein [Nitrospirota bacterium]